MQCYISRSAAGYDLCRLLQHETHVVTIRIHPSSPGNTTIYDHIPPLQAAITSQPTSLKYASLAVDKYHTFKDAHVVLTVQTFRNKMSGPSLYMFMRYYMTLGWPVIVYDRYGLHADVMTDFASSPQVIYHAHTFFEKLFPTAFNKNTAAAHTQVSTLFLPCTVSSLHSALTCGVLVC